MVSIFYSIKLHSLVQDNFIQSSADVDNYHQLLSFGLKFSAAAVVLFLVSKSKW